MNVRLRSECDATGLNVSLQVEMRKEMRYPASLTYLSISGWGWKV